MRCNSCVWVFHYPFPMHRYKHKYTHLHTYLDHTCIYSDIYTSIYTKCTLDLIVIYAYFYGKAMHFNALFTAV